MKTIAVLGLGQMGTKLARLLLRAGMKVHVWNRTPDKAASLASHGAVVADTAAEAAAAAEAIVICVHDYAATHAILSASGVKAALRGKLVLQLTTGSPQDARQLAAMAREAGAGYLDGAIQVAPEQMGQPDTTILVSGSRAAHADARGMLATLGGNIVYLGEDVAAAATMDLATLSYIYGASMGFFQGAALAQAEGLDVGVYGGIVEAMSPSFGAFLRHEGNVVETGDFAVSQSPLSISVDATRRIEQAMRHHGLRSELPALIAQLLHEAEQAGYANEEFAAVTKILKGAAAATPVR
ncbi:NAD(P)-dependent oxidoreductase [Cupriavidus gilardii]|jgi:3-hydroxyisobutyrate dehydrogenase-like beta-hydroxyacid dehydrogenase|uniref:NAD(P)-dependent oxidoreductase n=1 Tax=Cupriavidus gilardii TaxID=82541 RepID=UPI0015800E69|nr:NAD(P)-binding domain-containing protein [Cupriavidus gilardii]MCT9073063.1 NAD(P)-binding domain-containing protein [Cupriavidus gilardii]QKS65133.1 NAD(P)-dependent oxidoreductase [Cupriavidus gilardii]